MSHIEDLTKAQKFMKLSSQFMAAMGQVFPGTATERTVEDFLFIYKGFETFLSEGLPKTPLFTEHQIREKMAECLEQIGKVYEIIGDVENSLKYLEESKTAFSFIGANDAISRVDTLIRQIKTANFIDINHQIEELHRLIGITDSQSLDYPKLLVELAELLCKTWDDFESKRYLDEALSALQKQGNSEPDAFQMSAALKKSIGDIASGKYSGKYSEIEKSAEVRNLYRRIYMAFMRIYGKSDPDKAKMYDEKLRAMDGEGLRNSFAQEMEKLLSGTAGDFIFNIRK